MIRRLSELGLLEHVPYRGVALTDDGRRAALRMVRRHRIIEAYLVAQLGYTWDGVHEEAERLEHAVSDELIERMAHALGHPQFDPHGDPIPDVHGHVEDVMSVPLSEVPVGERVEIHRVDTSHADRLRYLSEMGLTPGTAVRVTGRQPFEGPLTIERDGQAQIIGHELARQLLCVRNPDFV